MPPELAHRAPRRMGRLVEAALNGSAEALLVVPGGPGTGGDLRRMAPERGAAEDTALIMMTSGPPGDPKGVELSAEALRRAAAGMHERLGGPGQWLVALPCSHIGGMQAMVRSWVAGIPPVVMDPGRFDPREFLRAVDRMDPGVRHFTALVPTQLERLLEAGADLSALDGILVGTSRTPGHLVHRARDAGAQLRLSYGMTETCGGCVVDGVPLDHVRIRLGAGGRIEIGGAGVASRYRLDPVRTASRFRSGYFRAADIGGWEADGTLKVVRRADDVISSGGVEVSAADVESSLRRHEHVRDCAVVGFPDDVGAERIVAIVVPDDGARVPSLSELRRHVMADSAWYRAPRQLIVLDSLPCGPAGQVDRALLKRLPSRSLADGDVVGEDGVHKVLRMETRE